MTPGAGRQVAAQHSNSFEGWYAHVPGLRVLSPATVEDARGMLAPALADPDPVLIFEHAQLYNREEEIADRVSVDITRAAVRRAGTDVSLITHGGSLHKALTAAEELARLGISAEVVDLRVLRPLDDATILAFYELDAPLARVCSEEVPIPYARHLEEAALPQVDKIVATAQALMGKTS